MAGPSFKVSKASHDASFCAPLKRGFLRCLEQERTEIDGREVGKKQSSAGIQVQSMKLQGCLRSHISKILREQRVTEVVSLSHNLSSFRYSHSEKDEPDVT